MHLLGFFMHAYDSMTVTDTFPTPWNILDTGSSYKITDARGRPVAFCYYRREEALRNEYPAQEEAKQMAQAIARLSRLSPPP